MTAKKEKLIRTTVQLSPHQHKALESLSGPGKSISNLVRTAVDMYLEPIYEQAYEDEKMDKYFSGLEEAENRMKELYEKATTVEGILDDLGATAK